jgi:hypothetical protein
MKVLELSLGRWSADYNTMNKRRIVFSTQLSAMDSITCGILHLRRKTYKRDAPIRFVLTSDVSSGESAENAVVFHSVELVVT